jgi:hypothetical protein
MSLLVLAPPPPPLLAKRQSTYLYYTEVRKTKREESGAAVLDVPLAKVVGMEQIGEGGRDTEEGRGEGKQRECLCPFIVQNNLACDGYMESTCCCVQASF